MDRNSIIGIILIAVILIGYSLLTRPSREELKEAKRRADSLELVRQEQMDSVPDTTGVQQKKPLKEPVVQKEQEKGVKKDSQDRDRLKSLWGAFAESATGDQEFITMENDLMKVEVASKGGRIWSVELKNYKTHDSLPLILFDGDSTVFGMNFFAQNRSIATNELFFTPRTDERNIRVENDPRSLVMRLNAGEGRFLEYVYTMYPGKYILDCSIRMKNMQEVISSNINYIDLNWEVFVPGLEKGRQNENNYTTIYYKHHKDEVDHFRGRSNKEIQEEDIPTSLKWVAFKQQFFSSVLIAGEQFLNGTVQSVDLEDSQRYLKRFATQLGVPYSAGSETKVPLHFYFGPNHFQTLKKQGMELQELVSLGGFISTAINRYLIIPVFNFLSGFIESYGIIILLLTIMIKVFLFPLTYRSYLSQAKMRVLKPEIDEINKKIPKDKAMERQQSTMALYKKAGVSPLGGCLPMLLQFPILFAMFRFFPTSIELRQESFLWAQDLSTYDSILDLPFNIPFYGDHVSLFTILMTASTIVSMRISNQSTPSSSQMPGMKGMMYIMPVMFMFILNNFSAALTYYYFLANLITFGQNALFKQYIDEEELRKKMKTNQKKPKKQSKFQKRLEEMARQRGVQVPKK